MTGESAHHLGDGAVLHNSNCPVMAPASCAGAGHQYAYPLWRLAGGLGRCARPSGCSVDPYASLPGASHCPGISLSSGITNAAYQDILYEILCSKALKAANFLHPSLSRAANLTHDTCKWQRFRQFTLPGLPLPFLFPCKGKRGITWPLA